MTGKQQPSYHSWQRILFVLVFAQFMAGLGFSSMFPFLPYYIAELGSVTGTNIEILSGLVYSGQAFTMMLASPLWGMVADRRGRKLMVERATFGGAIILLLMAYARSAEDLVALRALQGLVTGTVAAANALLAAHIPKNRAGFGMGMLQVSLGSGIAIGPLLGGLVADAFGYRSVFYITAGLLFISGLIVLWGIHEEFIPPPRSEAKRTPMMASWANILRTPGVWVAYAIGFITHMGRMMIIPIAPLFIVELMRTTEGLNTMTGLITSVSSITITVSSMFLGRLGDRIGYRQIILVCTALSALLYIPHSFVNTAGQLLILQAIVGIALGGIGPSVSALLANLSTKGNEGAVYGLDNSINAAGRAVAPMIGSTVALAFGLRATFIATSFVFIVCLVLAYVFVPKIQVETSLS